MSDNRVIPTATIILLLVGAILSGAAQANLLRDPMRPANSQGGKSIVSKPISPKALVKPDPALVLSAITYTLDAPSRSAIINDLWVKHGSVVNGATVLHIGDDAVELLRAGKKITVYLVPKIKSAPTES